MWIRTKTRCYLICLVAKISIAWANAVDSAAMPLVGGDTLGAQGGALIGFMSGPSAGTGPGLVWAEGWGLSPTGQSQPGMVHQGDGSGPSQRRIILAA
jgi:hypothetical protein